MKLSLHIASFVAGVLFVVALFYINWLGYPAKANDDVYAIKPNGRLHWLPVGTRIMHSRNGTCSEVARVQLSDTALVCKFVPGSGHADDTNLSVHRQLRPDERFLQRDFWLRWDPTTHRTWAEGCWDGHSYYTGQAAINTLVDSLKQELRR